MADQTQDRTPNSTTENGGSSLANFITEQYDQQRQSGQMDSTAELSDERTANFFNRALNESSRMNKEIDKNRKKLSKLQQEFGSEMITAWRNEHAAEVLTVKEAEAVVRAENGAFA